MRSKLPVMDRHSISMKNMMAWEIKFTHPYVFNNHPLLTQTLFTYPISYPKHLLHPQWLLFTQRFISDQTRQKVMAILEVRNVWSEKLLPISFF